MLFFARAIFDRVISLILIDALRRPWNRE